MTEVQTQMTLEEFQQHHTRTWDYVARVGKIWERIAEEQQAIIDGKGYRHKGYARWDDYWNEEFGKTTGWSSETIRKGWMTARRRKLETLEAAGSAPATYEDLGPQQWRDLAAIEDPTERIAFLTHYEEYKPEGTSRYPFRSAIAEFKGGREPTVRDVLSPRDMADLPDPELTASERWVYETGKIVSSLRRLTPEEVAEDTYRMMPDKLSWEVDAANQIIDWYERYKQALHAQKSQGIRRVK